MSDDVATLIDKARSVLNRAQRQQARFFNGHLSGDGRGAASGAAGAARSRPKQDGKSPHGSASRRIGSRRKEDLGSKDISGPSSSFDRQRKTTRPSWLCVPQCSRRSLTGRCDRSRRSLSVPLARLGSGPPASAKLPNLEPALNESDVESILLRDKLENGFTSSKKPKDTFATDEQPSREMSRTSSNCSSNDLTQRDSDVSVNTFVARQVQSIMQKAASNMVDMRSSFARDSGDTMSSSMVRAVRRQISRAAAYTAVCRRLEHALHLYRETEPFRAFSRRGSSTMIPRGSLPMTSNRRRSSGQNYNQRHSQRQRQDHQSRHHQLHVSQLPKNTLLAIFSLLDQRDLALSVAPVCRQWRYLAHHRSLWRHFLLDRRSDVDGGIGRVSPTCALLATMPGLWTLELVGCADVDRLLWQVVNSCRRIRTLAVDSCKVSDSMKAASHDAPCAVTELLSKCKSLHTLIIAFTPSLMTPSFFVVLGSKCWRMRCFLVSANISDVKLFFESASWHAPGAKSKISIGGARAAILQAAVDDRPADTKLSSLLQWRLHRNHAIATYRGVNFRVEIPDQKSSLDHSGLDSSVEMIRS